MLSTWANRRCCSTTSAVSFQQKRQQVLLLDDVGKLPNECYRVIQLIYDKLGERCGIVLTGTNYLKQHLLKCAAADKMSFRELVRRIRNKEWGLLKKPSPKEIATFFRRRYGGRCRRKTRTHRLCKIPRNGMHRVSTPPRCAA
jgi:hypothetical protein